MLERIFRLDFLERSLQIRQQQIHDLMGDAEIYFAANLNVMLEGAAVERHMTTPLHMLPGLINMAISEVHVIQRSSERETVVEFSFDADAAGPGCYRV